MATHQLSAAQRHQLLIEHNDTEDPDRAGDATLTELFAAQAARSPDAVAVVWPLDAGGEERLSYGELARRAGMLAARLVELGVGVESRVGVCVGRSPALVEVLLGVLQAGGAYVALDPAYPAERLEIILEDVQHGQDAPVVVSEPRWRDRLPAAALERSTVLWLEHTPLPCGRDLPSPPSGVSESLAYVLYTSGSTGRPKGVAIAQRSAVALVRWARSAFSERELSGMLATTSINFDLSVFELFAPLTCGGTVILLDNALTLANFAARHRQPLAARLLNTVPSVAAELLRLNALPTGLETINLAGEPLRRNLVRELLALPGVERVLDLYGPSEDTTYSTCSRRRADGPETIGRPITATRVYVVDPALEPVARGEVGELCLAGAGLARGYLRRPGLTAERFVPEPWSGERGARLYRTGDLGRFMPDGELQFLGRRDHQVKLRGFRIELREIEQRLLDDRRLQEAVVIVRDERLVAYALGDPENLDGEDLRRDLERSLPAYMMPSQVVVRAELPRHENGKLDRQAIARLPLPARSASLSGPEGPDEELIAEIFSEVLDVERVGRDESFFTLGGHSLLAGKVIARLVARRGVEIPLQSFFASPTVAGLASVIVEAPADGPLASRPPLVHRSRRGPVRLSFAQERLWLIDQVYRDGAMYHLPWPLRLRGPLDAAALAASLGVVIERHEVLRTIYVRENEDGPRQIILPAEPVVLPCVDLSGLDDPASEAAKLRREEARRPFDMVRGPMLRAVLARLASDEHHLLLTLHHIAADGWSLGLLAQELEAFYRAATSGRSAEVAELPVQYADYARWQRQWLTGEVLETQIAFYRQALAGAPALLELPLDRPRPTEASFRGAEVCRVLDRHRVDALTALAQHSGGTFFMALLAAFAALLARLSGQRDLCLGTPVAGRTDERLEGLIGFFINTLVLRSRLAPHTTWTSFFAATRQQVLAAFAHQDVPFERLVEELQPRRSLGHTPLFQVMLALQNTPGRASWDALELEPLAVEVEHEPFDLTLAGKETARGFELRFAYSRDLFDRTTVERWLAGLVTLIDGVLGSDQRAPLQEIEVMSPGERAQLLAELSVTPLPEEPRGTMLYPLIRAQAEQTPERIAAVAGPASLSYQALTLAAEGLAAELRIGPEQVVALAVEPSLELLVGMLATWRAGGVYLPLDPALPPERRRFMLSDARAAVMLAGEARLGELMNGVEARPVKLDAARHLCSAPPTLPALATGDGADEALAYIIYTSGSTGRPKGVGVAQRALTRHSELMARLFELGGDDAMAPFSSPSFDASLEDFLPPLLAGARVVFHPGERLAEEAFLPWLVRHRIAAADLPVVFWQRLTAVWAARPDLVAGHALRLLLVGGEAVPSETARRFVALEGQRPLLVNAYGPTEGVISATWGKVQAAPLAAWPWSSVAIGRPLPERSVRVLDPGLRTAPFGVAGELALGGTALARGYLGRPGATAASFVPDDAADAVGGRLYLTGDRVRWHAEHGLEFLGRADQQVKLRGFRVELGEIAAALGEHPAIAQAVVRVTRDPRGADQLVAYLPRRAEPAISTGDLRRFLATRLPEPMLPAVFVELDAWPLTAGGKVDVHALPAPDWEAAVATERPQTPIEEIVAGIWSEVLAIDGEALSGLGPRSEFFALGGHSLLATQVMARISKLLGVELPVRTLFEAPSLAAFAAVVAESDGGSSADAPPPLAHTARLGQVEPSYAQERLWLVDQLLIDKSVYNIPWPLAISGELNVPALGGALAEVARRHEVLRTVYPAIEGRPAPRIESLAGQLLPVVDLSALDAPAKAARRLRAAEAQRPFDLIRGPVFRTTLLRLGADEHQLLFNVHHIAGDGWSLTLLGRELGALYTAAIAGQPSPLAPLPVTYADYAAWQRGWLQGEVLTAQLDFWRRELAAAPPLLELPTDRPRPAVAGFAGALAVRHLPPALTRAVRALARQTGSTFFMVLLAAFHALLARHAGQRRISVGTTVAGRRRLELEALIGFFVNPLVLSIELEPAMSFADLVARMRRKVLDALAHQDLPFERLVEELQPQRSTSFAPLFQVIFQSEGEDQVAIPDWHTLRIRELPLDDEPAKFDLILSCRASDQGLRCTASYNRELFDATTVERWLARFELLLAQGVASPDRQLAAFDLRSAAERHQLLSEWNDRAAAFPHHLAIPEVFAMTVDPRRDAVAVVAAAEGSCLSYAELARRSNGIAWTLIERGAGPESLVGLDVERTPEAVAALLGILAAGAAYVPLDRDYPAERLRFMVEDTGLELMLSDAETGDAGWGELELEVLSRDGEPGWGRPSPRRPRSPVGAENLAYVMYTSGSTGRPKGVGVNHRNILRLVLGVSYVELGSDVTMLQLAPISFDLSTLEVWAPLLNGGRLAVHPSGPLSLAELDDVLTAQRVDTLWLTAGLFHQVVEERPRALAAVRQLLAGGDVLAPEAVARVLKRQPWTTLINGYGPTEATTFASSHPMRSPDQVGGTVSIGRPIDNARVHILDRCLAAQPLGVIGELWVAGDGVSRGYFGRPRATAERFCPEPEAPAPGERMYRTGDRARWLADGALEFLGRGDSQVKIRGFRVEPGEIEAHLAEHPQLAQVLVMARDDAFGTTNADRRLVAYVVPAPDARPAARELEGFLAERLPRYMVPAAFVVLDAFPLGPTGKVDRRALPRPERPEGAGYVAPQGAVEEGLAAIWQEVLGLARIGSGDDFFALGGHSLLASRMMARIEARFGHRLSLRQLFLSPTIAGLAPHLGEALQTASATPLVPRSPDEPPVLSFAQERVWFLDRLQPGKATYTIPWPLVLDGPLDRAALAWSLRELLRRHEVLRTVFELADGQPAPVVREPADDILPIVDLSALEAPVEEARQLQEADALRPIDLTRGPLLRATLLALAPRRHHLLLNVHHIASDGWSMDVLERELSALYGARVAGRPSPLTEPVLQYADFAVWQRRVVTGDVLERGLAHGRSSLDGAPPQLALPTDRPRPAMLSDRGAELPLSLAPEVVGELKPILAELGVTPFIGLLAAFAAVLGRHSGQDDVVVGAPIAGRQHLLLEDLIGLFLNNLALRARLDGEPSFRQLSRRLRDVVLAAHQHQEVPFEKLVEELQPQRSLNVNPLFQVLLNVHNWGASRQGSTGLTLPGVAAERLEALGEEPSKFDLTLHVLEDGAGMTLFWLYHTDLFDRATIARLAGHFMTLLGAAVRHPDAPLAELSCLSAAEGHQLLHEWNDTTPGALPVTCLHDAFVHRAELQGDALALIFGDSALSYRELARRSASLAGRLRELGVGPETRVGLAVDRSFEMVIAVLAVLRAGGAYVPLDPKLPAERLGLMLADSRAAVLLFDRALEARLPAFDGPRCEVRESLGTPTPACEAGAENLAYVIYTSGTTGRPKGVMCRHGGAVSYLRFMSQTFDLAPGDITLQLASLAFDPSVRELFGPLGAGSSVVLVDADERRDPAALLRRAGERRITHLLSVVPSLLRLLPATGESFPALRGVMTNGERLLISDVHHARDALGEHVAVVNQYGPTECTMVASWHRAELDAQPPGRDVILIGRPILGRRVHLLDRRLRPAPIGVLGELHVATPDLARGYLDRPRQTAESFLPDPFAAPPGSRMYASGDLGRRLTGGRIEFIGRRDHQVKVSGQRVELGEIEAALLRQPGISGAVVVAWQPSLEDVRLVAYVESRDGETRTDDLRRALLEILPEVMVPSAWVFLDRLPLSPNGKIDRRALPDPATAEVGRVGVFTAPRSPVEELLAALWSEILSVERIGVHDPFFALGGHSLAAIRLVYRLQEFLGVDIEVRTVFEAQTLEELALRVEDAVLTKLAGLSEEEARRSFLTLRPDGSPAWPAKDGDRALPPSLAARLDDLTAAHRSLRAEWLRRGREQSDEERGIPRRADRRRAPLAWMQESFWMIEQLEQGEVSVYRSNHRLLFTAPVDLVALRQSFVKIVERHEILRTRFDEDEEGQTYQEVLDHLSVPLPVVDLTALRSDIREREEQQVLQARSHIRLDLRQAPVWRLLLVRLSGEETSLLVSMHHIINDFWSMDRIFFPEMAACYGAYARGAEPRLDELPIQFGDYAQWERDRLSDDVLAELMVYWGEKMAGGIPQLDLYTDRPRPEAPRFHGALLTFAMSVELTAALEELGRKTEASPFMIALAAYKLLLHRYSGQDDIVVGSPSTNRFRVQTEKLCGCFVNMLLLRTSLEGDPRLGELVVRVRETVLGAFSHQEMPFMAILGSFPPPDFAFDRPPFQAQFIFLNASDASPEAVGSPFSEAEAVDRGATDQDLALWLYHADRLYGTLIYDTDLFSKTTVLRMIDDYQQILTAICQRPEQRMSSFALRREDRPRGEERETVLAGAANR